MTDPLDEATAALDRALERVRVLRELLDRAPVGPVLDFVATEARRAMLELQAENVAAAAALAEAMAS